MTGEIAGGIVLGVMTLWCIYALVSILNRRVPWPLW